jgi:small subunit ribosomal protein S20
MRCSMRVLALGHTPVGPTERNQSGLDRTPNQRERPVANIKSQKKRNLTNAKAHARNKAVRSEMKSRVKAAQATGDDADVRAAIKRIDSAAQKGVIHKNAAARKKSRLMKQVNAD